MSIRNGGKGTLEKVKREISSSNASLLDIGLLPNYERMITSDRVFTLKYRYAVSHAVGFAVSIARYG